MPSRLLSRQGFIIDPSIGMTKPGLMNGIDMINDMTILRLRLELILSRDETDVMAEVQVIPTGAANARGVCSMRAMISSIRRSCERRPSGVFQRSFIS